MKKAAINTLGCRTNQLESSIIVEDLIKNGWEIVKFNEIADVYIINTCSVTAKSDNTSRYFIRQAKRTNPNAKVLVTGCYAQLSPDEISEMQEADIVIGNTHKQSIAEILKTESNEKIFVSDIMQEKVFEEREVHSAYSRTRASIKIQNGCNYRCSYCIIPYARGKSRSNPLPNVIQQVENLVNQGFQEIVLTGIHLGQWGLDLKPKQSLADLLKELEKIENLKRYRISSIDPMEFTDELIKTLSHSKKFCPHLHISLQSGNNEILKAMKRRYTVEYYSELINKLVRNLPDLAIGSDIIVGFPGETEEMFQNTYENLEKLPISYLHVFPYSKRKGTPAAEMQDQIKHEIKIARREKLVQLGKKKNLEFRKKLLNKEMDIVVELHRDKKTGYLKGLTGNFISVLLEGPNDLKNKLVKAQITEIAPDYTKGTIL